MPRGLGVLDALLQAECQPRAARGGEEDLDFGFVLSGFIGRAALYGIAAVYKV